MTEKGYLEGSSANHKSHWRAWARACRLYGWTQMPADERTLQRYTYHVLSNETIGGRTFINRLDGIRAIHVKMGYNVDFGEKAMPRLALQKRRFLQLRPPGLKEKEPITMGFLEQLLSTLDKECDDQQMMRAMLAFAYGGMLRVSEYHYGPRAKCKPKVGDIKEISEEHLVYEFRASKGNQLQERERVVMCCRCPRVCAVHEIWTMLKRKGDKLSREQNLFALSDGRSLRDDQINSLISKLCDELGIDDTNATSHCLRAGAITDALAAGVPQAIVQVLSRHKDPKSMLPYIRPSNATLSNVLRKKFGSQSHSEQWQRRYC